MQYDAARDQLLETVDDQNVARQRVADLVEALRRTQSAGEIWTRYDVDGRGRGRWRIYLRRT